MDYYSGSNGTDVVEGGPGNDAIYGSDGQDSLWGDGAMISFTAGTGSTLSSAAPTTTCCMAIMATTFWSEWTATTTSPGALEFDILYGGSGSDRLIGGDGGEVDALYGGDGVDRFQAGGNGYGTDYLWDFVPNVDRIAVWSGTTVAAQYTQSGNYYVDFTNGTRAVVVGVTALGAFDIELFGFV